MFHIIFQEGCEDAELHIHAEDVRGLLLGRPGCFLCIIMGSRI
jgi:hypothetical protein